MSTIRTTTVLILLIYTSMLTGCDKLTGAAEQKALDAVAIGYACRVSEKKPEDCMKENDSYSPDSILEGWKDADEALKNKAIELSAKQSAGANGDGNKPTDEKPTEKPAEKLMDKPMDKPIEKPAGSDANKDGKAGGDKPGMTKDALPTGGLKPTDAKGAAH